MPLERKLIVSETFKKSYQKFASKNQALKSSIGKALLNYKRNAPSLKTHKLSGKLVAYLTCSCGYDCRIIFTIEKDITNQSIENIILLDIGTHEDVIEY